ncbi:MAG: NUDIX domain-containing protein [Deltaproteobacteria bacterium]|nr:NUDIX domain-containing protein [Deltaproteobacteria bacterium]
MDVILSAGIVLVRWEMDEWKYLFLRAYGNWDFPKGVVESDEDFLKAAKREVQEETGIQDLQFRWGYPYCETEPYSGGKKVARYYLAETRSSRVVFSVNPEIGRPEHHEYRWVPYPQLKELAPTRLKPVVQWAGDTVGKT